MAEEPTKNSLIGEHALKLQTFDNVEKAISQFFDEPFEEVNSHEKVNAVNQALLKLIKSANISSFLLPCIIDFIARVNKKNILTHYTFSSFELWLNHFSELSEEENYQIRAKIVGKALPRDAYQIYFPVGMGKRYKGTHFVTAHHSPDLDTTVASFWGWIDAFGARVGDGLHIWNLPGGPPEAQAEIRLLFNECFGEKVFESVAKTRLSLTLTSLDLMTQSGLMKKYTHEVALSLDHQRQRSAIVLTDEKGYYLGDWRSIDVEGVRQVVIGLNNCLMWMEAFIHIQLISCFAKKDVIVKDISKIIRTILNTTINSSNPAKELTQKQQNYVNDYLIKVLKVKQGVAATFEEFALSMEALDIVNFTQIIHWLKSLVKSDLFDTNGVLTENRPLIFNQLEILAKMLSKAFEGIRTYVDRLEIAFKIKTEVFGFSPQFLTYKADIEEIRSKMRLYSYLTVNYTDLEDKEIPIGVVHASDLQQAALGTVSLRDFCNREEMKIPPYLQVISVIDHHKTSLETEMPPTIMISDAQSSNALLAQMAFSLNDQYGLGGMSAAQIESELKAFSNHLTSVSSIRIYQRLLQKKKNLQTKQPYFISPEREFLEYLHFVYAILDDTDLLTKVSPIDIECMGSLLNRLKSLTLKKEVEIIHFDDIAKGPEFTKKAAKHLMQNRDFYSLYSKVYLQKESEVESNLKNCTKGLKSNVFSDTKVLNVSNRVGQTKLFASNHPLFLQLSSQIRAAWYKGALKAYKNNPQLVLHLHMITTIASAKELFKGEEIDYTHLDEMWIWVPDTELALEHLKLFLSGLKGLPALETFHFSVEFHGKKAKEFSQVFKESFSNIPHVLPSEAFATEEIPVAVLRFRAGLLNSRKAMIAPYLPNLTV